MRDLLSFISFSHKNHDIIIFPKYLKFLLTALFFLAFFSSSALALQQLISLQGKVDLNGVLVSSGSVNVTIWDAATGGNVVYNSTGDFINSVQSGYFDITLGATTELNLSMNRIYWLDMEVNGNDIDWNGNERLQFQSPVGSNVFGNLNITDNLTVDTNTLYVDAINNRVGIGTASPYAGLQVNRTGTVLETNGTTLLAVSGGNVGINTASPSYRLQVAGNVSLNNSLYVTTAGNVGIGTAAPSTALDVRGRILLGGNDDMIFDNGQNMIMHNSGSNTLSIGTSGVANVVVYDRISITSASDLANVTIKNSTFIVRDGGVGIGTASPNAKLYVNDTLSNQHTLYVKNNATNPGLTIGYFLAPKATTSDTYILRAARNEGDNAFYVLADNTTYMAGNVGIGTTIPNATLQVMGAANILALNVNNTLYVNTTTSYVGIGTTGPTNAKLEIYTGENALNSNTGGAIAVYDTAGTALVGRIGSDSTIGAFTIFGDRGINLAAPGNNGIRFYQSTTERMRIADDTGNVGIGVTSPNSKLQVNGSILLGNANDIDFSIKPDSNIAYTGSSLYVSGGGVVGNGAGGNLYLSGGVGSSNQGQGDVYIYGGSNLTSRGDVILANDGSNSIGKVGINISSPTQMLTVKGDANITGTLYVGAQSFTTIDASGNLSIGGSASIISNITTNGSLWQPVYPSDDGLVLYLPFSEGIGTTAYDRSPYGNDGTLKNTSATCSGPVNKCPNWTTGKYGNALQFDGNETFVDVGSGASLDLINVTVTVEAWVKSSDAITASTDRRWISARSNGWDLGFDSGKVYFGKYKNTTCGFSGTQASFSANTWYHIAGVADPATCYIYINGVLDASATTTPNSNIPSGSGFVGAHVPLGSYRAWNGTIDEVRIYNRALSADEIRSQYLGGLQSHGTVVADKFRVVNTTGSKMFEVNQTAMVYNNSLLYVDNVNGRVGIGTTSPPDKLSINGGASAPQLTLYPGGTLFIDKGTGGISGGGYFSFASGTGVTIGMTDDSNSNHLIFKTRPAGGSETERVRIDSTGKVGINTTSPSDEVHLKGGDQTSYRVESTGNANARYMMNNTQGSWGIMARGTTGNFDIYDYDMGGEALSIKSGMGMIGIGTVNPTENLTVNGNFSAKNGNITGSVNLATLEGNVGIGTTAPGTLLEIYNSSADNSNQGLLRLHGKFADADIDSSDGVSIGVTWENSGGGTATASDAISLFYTAAGGNMALLPSGGNVGIGTTSPGSYKLNVAGTVNASAYVTNGTDYAEMMEKLYADERIEPGDVVGIVDGKATKRAENADSFMIVSENPGVIAGEGKNKVPVAFIGQVKVTVKGKVSRGDYILANKDGIAIAKPKANVTFEEYKEKVIGTAWESRSCMTTEGRLSDCEGIGKVLVAVGIK